MVEGAAGRQCPSGEGVEAPPQYAAHRRHLQVRVVRKHGAHHEGSGGLTYGATFLLMQWHIFHAAAF